METAWEILHELFTKTLISLYLLVHLSTSLEFPSAHKLSILIRRMLFPMCGPQSTKICHRSEQNKKRGKREFTVFLSLRGYTELEHIAQSLLRFQNHTMLLNSPGSRVNRWQNEGFTALIIVWVNFLYPFLSHSMSLRMCVCMCLPVGYFPREPWITGTILFSSASLCISSACLCPWLALLNADDC